MECILRGDDNEIPLKWYEAKSSLTAEDIEISSKANDIESSLKTADVESSPKTEHNQSSLKADIIKICRWKICWTEKS